MHTHIATAVVITTVIGTAAAAQEQSAPPKQTVADLTAFICPTEEETKWLNIPWRVSFWQGVQDSQIDGKPILLWAMNGHPLGCT